MSKKQQVHGEDRSKVKSERAKLKRELLKEPTEPEYDPQEYVSEDEIEDRKSKYWICDSCAYKGGLIAPDYAVTCIKGLCGHCDREDETLLTPVTDFKSKLVKYVWD